MIEPVILNNDCLEGLFGIPSSSVDLCLVDPPYFDYKTGHRKDKTDKLSQGIVQDIQGHRQGVRASVRVQFRSASEDWRSNAYTCLKQE